MSVRLTTGGGPVPQSSRVELTDAHRADLRTRMGSGVGTAHQVTRARILLKADPAQG